MRSISLTTTLFVSLLYLVSVPISTVGLQKKLWPKPSELATGQYHHKGSGSLGDSKVGLAYSSVSTPSISSPGLFPGLLNIPGIPKIPGIPNIPRLPPIPSLPNIPPIPGLPPIPSLPNLPELPPIPNLPNLPELPPIPSLPNLPGLPSLPGLPHLPPLELSQKAEMENCLTRDGSKTSEKCFSQIFSRWVVNGFALDKECCEIVMKMDKKCNNHVRLLSKSPFFAPLLRYSCHIKHAKN